MLETPLSDVMTKNVAISQSWYPTLDPSITVPVLVLKNCVGQAFSLHRNFMVGCLGRCWTLVDPHSGQHTPSGQRCSTSHFSAVSLSGNRFSHWARVMPSRSLLPGAFAIPLFYTKVTKDARGFGGISAYFVTLVYNPRFEGRVSTSAGNRAGLERPIREQLGPNDSAVFYS